MPPPPTLTTSILLSDPGSWTAFSTSEQWNLVDFMLVWLNCFAECNASQTSCPPCHMVRASPFLDADPVVLHGYCVLFFQSPVNGHDTMSWRLWIMSHYTWEWKSLFQILTSSLSDKYPKVELIDHTVILILSLWGPFTMVCFPRQMQHFTPLTSAHRGPASPPSAACLLLSSMGSSWMTLCPGSNLYSRCK